MNLLVFDRGKILYIGRDEIAATAAFLAYLKETASSSLVMRPVTSLYEAATVMAASWTYEDPQDFPIYYYVVTTPTGIEYFGTEAPKGAEVLQRELNLRHDAKLDHVKNLDDLLVLLEKYKSPPKVVDYIQRAVETTRRLGQQAKGMFTELLKK